MIRNFILHDSAMYNHFMTAEMEELSLDDINFLEY